MGYYRFMKATTTTSPMLKFLSDRVRERRVELGMSQSELADQIGCYQPDISELEQGKANPRLNLLHLLSCSLRVPPSHFILDEPPCR